MTERAVTHYVGDDCLPDGHRGELAEHACEVALHSAALDLSWCACGRELKHGKWRAPRTAEGTLRRIQWDAAQAGQQRGREG